MGHGSAESRHTVVTSFNLAIYRRYAHRFVESFAQQTWEAVKAGTAPSLVIYAEPDIAYSLNGLFQIFPYELTTGLMAYEGAIRQLPVLCGRWGDKYDIFHDGTQARGAFIACDAMERFGGKIWWMDADVITHAPVTAADLDRLLPDSALCCHVGRDGWSYTETGIVGLNASHPRAPEFVGCLREFFARGWIFTQPQWHDCIGFDYIRLNVFKNDPALFIDLAADRSKVPEGCMHPLANCELGNWFDHLKGDRKDTGRPRPGDLAWPRPEPYWQGVYQEPQTV